MAIYNGEKARLVTTRKRISKHIQYVTSRCEEHSLDLIFLQPPTDSYGDGGRGERGLANSLPALHWLAGVM